MVQPLLVLVLMAVETTAKSHARLALYRETVQEELRKFKSLFLSIFLKKS